MSMYTIVKQLFSPTAVEHCLQANFTAPNHNNLIVAKGHLLQIYIVEERESSPSSDKSSNDAEQSEYSVYPKLERLEKSQFMMAHLNLLQEYHLHGVIESMAAIRTTQDSVDSVLLSFNEAKMSLVKFNPSINSMETTSLHFFEREDLKTEFLINPTISSKIIVEPANRCALLQLYRDCFAILPFRHSDNLNSTGDEEEVKWPYLPSFLVKTIEIESSIKNVVDIAFLHDYYEPTLAILYEANPTWTGRTKMKKDTMCIVVVCLDLSKKQFPILYTLKDLPYNCNKIVAVPKPIGGLLIFSTNILIHVDQSSLPGTAVGLNKFSTIASDFPHQSLEDNSISLFLDNCKHLFLDSHSVLLCMQSGDLYILDIVLEGRSVSHFNIQQVGTSVIPSCTTKLMNDYFFLGSKMGDSVVIKYNEKTVDSKSGPGQKTFVSDFEMDLYGTDNNIPNNNDFFGPSKSSQMRFSFHICDSLLNVGPISDLAVGHNALFQEKEENVRRSMDILTCSGNGKSGSIAVLKRDVFPDILSSFDLRCDRIWSIKVSSLKGKISVQATIEQDYDNYLVLSKDNETMILETGDELKQLQKSGFYTEGPTIYAGTILNGSRIIQVYETGVKVLSPEAKLQQEVPFEDSTSNVSIREVSVEDPYILLIFSDNSVALLQGDPYTKDLTICQLPGFISNSKPVTGCLYRDKYDTWMMLDKARTAHSKKMASYKSSSKFTPSNIKKQDDLDDIDMDLYGEALEDNGTVDVEMKEEDSFIKEEKDMIDEVHFPVVNDFLNLNTKQCWLILLSEEGLLSFYSVPEFQLLFVNSNFEVLPTLLSHTEVSDRSFKKPSVHHSNIKKMRVVGLGDTQDDLYLFAITKQNDLIMYHAFPYLYEGEDLSGNVLALRFSRVSHFHISRDFSNHLEENDFDFEFKCNVDLVPFTNIGGYSGLFLTGPFPAWVLYTPRKFIRVHPMNFDDEVICFTSFHNVHCKEGFVFYNKKGNLRICQLSKMFNYECNWTVRKSILRRTPRFISYHPLSRKYGLITSTPAPFVIPNEDDDKPVESDDLPKPLVEKYTLELLSGVILDSVHKHEFEQNEHVMCIKTVNLESKQTKTGRKLFLAVGTALTKGEDTTTKGRVYIFEIIDVVPEPDNPETNHKMKLLCTAEDRGPVTAIESVNGYLLTTFATKITLRSFEDNENLLPCAFVDVQISALSTSSINNFILLGDAYKSIWFLAFQEYPPKVVLLGKDYHPLQTNAVEYLVQNNMMYFVVADVDKNLHLFSYAPYNVQSLSGQKLVRKGDFHTGTSITKFLRMGVLPSKVKEESLNKSSEGNNEIESAQTSSQFCIFGTMEGALSMIYPISEKEYKRMLILQGQLVNGIQHPAGLNPKAFRLLNSNERLASNPMKSILDGDLLFQFLNLGLSQQKEITKQLGTISVDKVLDDFTQLMRSIDYF